MGRELEHDSRPPTWARRCTDIAELASSEQPAAGVGRGGTADCGARGQLLRRSRALSRCCEQGKGDWPHRAPARGPRQ